ncbi:MAG: hypothetical protein HOQ18_06960 [Dermatophilaceae bacterium]|nr:hypothetical protein [Dermatophilaceae bacterium]NUR80319.1 hypothetical protein [Dermatophilaceae bacterium]
MVGLQQPRGSATGSRRGPGLSAAGWALVMALCALAITGGVSVLTHLLPPPATGHDAAAVVSTSGGGTASRAGVEADEALLTPAPAPVPPPRAAALEQLTGTWTGLARLDGHRTPMTLVVTGSCGEGGDCGTLSTDGPPCVGNLRLLHVSDGPVFEFSIPSYASGSSPACVPHSDGELFVLGDDVLAYRSEFGEGRTGRLTRVH